MSRTVLRAAAIGAALVAIVLAGAQPAAAQETAPPAAAPEPAAPNVTPAPQPAPLLPEPQPNAPAAAPSAPGAASHNTSRTQFNDVLGELERAEAAAFERLRVNDLVGAMPFVAESLRLNETIYGPDSIEAGAAAQNLGFLFNNTGRAAQAIPYFERALAIYERTQPPTYGNTGKVAAMLGELYLQAGRQEDALRIIEKQIARAEEAGADKDVAIAQMHVQVAGLLRTMNRPDDAAAHWERAVSIFKEQGSPADEAYQVAIAGLLSRYTAAGQVDEARKLITETLQQLRSQGEDQGRTALALHNQLSRLEHGAGRYAESKQHAQAALSILEKEGTATGPAAVEPLNNLARAERALADNAAAEEHYKRAIALLDSKGDSANSGILNDNLAVLYGQTGRYDEAEPHHKRALELLEKVLGREHRSVGRAAANFGVFLNEAGRYAEAEPLLRRGLAIAEAQSPQDPVSVGIILDNLGGLLRQTGRGQEAMDATRRALGLFEQALPADHPTLATSRNNFGRLLLDLGQYEQAETQLKRAVETNERLYGAEHLNVAVPMANLGEAYTAMGRRDEARGLLTKALAIMERQFGAEHTKLLDTLVALGRLELADSRPADARGFYERAVGIELASRSRFGVRSRASREQRTTERSAFLGLLEALWQTREGSDGLNPDRALEVGQWNTMTPAAMALTALGARAGAGDPALAALTRERQDLAADWEATDKKLTQILAKTSDRDAGAEQSLRDRLAAAETRIGELDKELLAKFPRFENLAKPAPLTVKDVRFLLQPNEVALQYVTTPDVTYAWLISADDMRWVRLPVGERDLLSLVRALRCGLDRAEWQDSGRDRCLTRLGLPKDKTLGVAEALPFQPERAHALYQILFGQFGDIIKGKDLLIVASGALTSLPFHVLVSQKPETGAEGADFSKLAWVGREHAVTMLPSLASLKSLRVFAPSSEAKGPFLGMGNPLLTGESGTDRTAWERQSCPPQMEMVAASPAVASASPLPLLRSGLSTVEALRRQTPIPDTAEELCRVAQFVGAGPETVLLGSNATESRIKSLSADGTLANARILHLATHGLIADETAAFVASLAEPSLMFTPPETPSETDDGLLTATEVAALKLDADWVVLSACNTASGDEVGAEALSGLARAFFYAGARSLMVSHWAVDSRATVKLITGAFSAMTENPGLSHAGALQRSMLAMIESGGADAHPAYWAPFVIVGSDGRTRQIVQDDAPVIIPPVPAKGPVATEAVKQAARDAASIEIPPPPTRLVIEPEPAIIPPLPTKATGPEPQRPASIRRQQSQPTPRRTSSTSSPATTQSTQPSQSSQATSSAAQGQSGSQAESSQPSASSTSQSGGSLWDELFGQ